MESFSEYVDTKIQNENIDPLSLVIHNTIREIDP